MDEQRRLGDKWREGDVEVARSLAVPVGQDKVPSLKCSVTSTPLQGSRKRPLSAPLRGSLHQAPGFDGGYLPRPGIAPAPRLYILTPPVSDPAALAESLAEVFRAIEVAAVLLR